MQHRVHSVACKSRKPIDKNERHECRLVTSTTKEQNKPASKVGMDDWSSNALQRHKGYRSETLGPLDEALATAFLIYFLEPLPFDPLVDHTK